MSAPPITAAVAPTRRHHHLTLAVLVMSAMAYALQQTLVAPALPAIQAELGTSTTAVSYLLTGFLLAASVATPILGRLGDMFGKKRMLVATLVVFAAGSLVSALSDSIGWLIAGRVLQGVAGAVFPLAFGIIRDEFPRQKVAAGIGMISATMGVGGAAGVVLSGPIVDNLDYRWVFWFGLAFTLLTLALTVALVPESPITSPGRVDWVGAALLSGALVALLVGVSEGNAWGWQDARILGLFAAAGALSAAWIGWEQRHPAPLVDMAMMRRRAVWTTNLVAALIGFGLYSSFLMLPKFVQAPAEAGYGFGADVTAAGLYMLPSAAAMLVAGPATGYLATRFGARAPLLGGIVLVAGSFVWLAFWHDAGWMVATAGGISGLGVGCAVTAMPALIIDAVEPSRTGVATGMNAIMRTVGGAIGGQICAAILAAQVLTSGVPTESAYTLAFGLLAAVSALALLVGLRIPARRASSAPAP